MKLVQWLIFIVLFSSSAYCESQPKPLVATRRKEINWVERAQWKRIKTLGSNYLRHANTVTGVRFTSSGRFLVSSGEDGAINVWDLDEKKVKIKIQLPLLHMTSLALSPDEKTILAGSDNALHGWDLNTGDERFKVATASKWSTGIRCSKDGRWAELRYGLLAKEAPEKFCLSGSRKPPPTWLPWPNAQETLLKSTRLTLFNHLHPLKKNVPGDLIVSLAPDKKSCIAGWGNSVGCFLLPSGKPIWIKHNHLEMIWAVDYAKNGNRVAAADYNGRILVLKADTGVPSIPHIDRFAGIHAIAMIAPNDHIVAGYGDGKIRIWDPMQGLMITQWQAHSAEIQDIKRSSDGRYILTCGADHMIRLWQIKENSLPESKPVWEYKNSYNPPCTAFSSDGKFIAWVEFNEKHKIQLFDLAANKVKRTIEPKSSLPVKKIAFRSDNTTLMVADKNHARVFDLNTGLCFGLMATAKNPPEPDYRSTEGRGWVLSNDLLIYLELGFYGEGEDWEWTRARMLQLKALDLVPQNMNALVADLDHEEFQNRTQAIDNMLNRGPAIMKSLVRARAKVKKSLAARIDELFGIMKRRMLTTTRGSCLFSEKLYQVAISDSGGSWVALLSEDKKERTVYWGSILNEERHFMELNEGISENGHVTCMAFAPNGHFLVCGNQDGTFSIIGMPENK